MKKGKIRVLSAFLVFSVLFLSIPANALSVTGSNNEQDSKAEENAGVIAEDETFIVEEDTSKRGQFEKHFLCSDGSYIAVTYPETVHYLNNDNYWEDVDLTPEYNTSTGKYAKNNGSFGYSFRESASSDDMVEIRTGEHTISWGLEIAQKNESKESDIAAVTNQAPVENTRVLTISEAKAEIIQENGYNNTGKKYITDSKSFQLSNISAKIKYGNYTEDDSISLEYTVYQDKIEEDIIIGKKGTADSFTMNMNIGNLMPKVNPDGSVFLTDESGEVISRIGIPYTVDSAFAVCNDISVKAEKSGTNCKITYIPNKEWMNSPDRVYPVTLDPSISTNDYVSNIEDTYVEENSSVNHSCEQFLYINRNGSRKRNTVIRINHLPVIDDSMPILYAYLELTAQSVSSEYIDMKAGYLDTGLDFSDYDYSITSLGNYTFVEYSCLDDENSTMDFDVSSHIYSMYEDVKWDEEHGYDYNGDFVVGLEYENDTSYVPPFYSSEYTGTASRPKLKIRYGYSLPAGILNNGIYSFMNCESAGYMSVNGTNPANNSNIYQLLGNGNGAQLYQKFKLEYVHSTGGYLLRSMASSSGADKVVSVNRGTSNVSANMNVRLSSPGDSLGQEWLIVPVNYYEFKIVPRTNMSLAITAYGYGNGSNTGTSYSSTGNIFVKEYDSDNYYQKWYIEDPYGDEIYNDLFRSLNETGTYYVSNRYSGKYLHRNSHIVNCARDKKATLGENTVQWRIVNLGDGYCTIQRVDLPSYYLARDDNSNNGVKVIYNSSDTIPEKCKWNIRYITGGCLVQNFYGKYLTYNSSNSTVTLSNLSSAGTDSYKMQQWRFVEEEDYTELGYGVSFSDFSLDIGESKTAIVNKSPSTASWSNYNDFEYSIISGGQCVSFNNSTGKFTGITFGISEIRATHKTTGISRSFYAFVSNGIDSIECLKNNTFNIRTLKLNNSQGVTHLTWHSMDSSIATVSSAGVITGVNTGYTIVYSTVNNSSLIAFVYEVKITDIHTQMLEDFTTNEIQYLYCNSAYLNNCTRIYSNAFELKVEIINAFREYVVLPDELHPSPSETLDILEDLGITCSESFAQALFYECYLGHYGLYNQDFLTAQRITYFNYLKEIVCFCAFGMASQLDTVNSGSSYNGLSELNEDLASCWTNNKESSNVMLGTNYGGRSYVKVAQDGNYKYFYSNDYDYYKNIYGIDFTRDINMRFLDKCFEQNCAFYFSHNPTAYTGGSLFIEYQYIITHYSQLGFTPTLIQIADDLWKIIIT